MKKLTQTPNIKSSIDSFVTRIRSRAPDMETDDLQAALRDFVHNTHTTLAAHPIWRKVNASDLHEAELHLQEYLSLYFFNCNNLFDENADTCWNICMTISLRHEKKTEKKISKYMNTSRNAISSHLSTLTSLSSVNTKVSF